MYNAIKSLYCCALSFIRVNGLKTYWFDVTTRLRQGCCLSRLLFNIFINDLSLKINSLGLGINIGNNETLSLLMYADDIVLLAESENDLQQMLNSLSIAVMLIICQLMQIKLILFILDQNL